MNTKLYQQLFNKLDSLSAIRKDLSFGCEVILTSTGGSNKRGAILEINKHYSKYLSKSGILSNNNANRRFKQSWEIKEIIGHPPVLTDCLKAINKGKFGIPLATTVLMEWDLSKPFLSEQGDELGEYLLTLLG